jgi:outer membrane immunogenic protein
VGELVKRYLYTFAVSLTVGLPTAALSADLPAKAPSSTIAAIYNWSGFFFGANAGGGFGHSCWTNTLTAAGPTVPAAPEGCHDVTGAIIGGQIGYRWQLNTFVLGVEAQGDWANLKGTNASSFFQGVNNQTKTEAIGLFTGQFGYSWNSVLWYVKGGPAVVSRRFAGNISGTDLGLNSSSDTTWGPAIGAGMEFALAQNWSIGIEYNRLFLGTRSLAFTTPQSTFSRVERINEDVDLATIRLNYRFGAPLLSKY